MSSKLPTGVQKLPPGVEIQGNMIRVSFYLNGQRCKEPLAGVVKITKAAIAYADNKRRTILAEIAEGRFDYQAHFPDSKRAAILAGASGDNRRTVEEGVVRWLAVQEAKRAGSTSANYGYKSRHVLEWFKGRRIADINKSDLELFQAGLLKKGLAPKTVNDIFTVVRGVWGDAFADGVVRANPLERISNVERDIDDDFADPFTRDEIATMERLMRDTGKRQPDIRMFLFDCWAGLSVSELIAIGIDDIDTENWTLNVRRAHVHGVYKVPKERSRVRHLELIDPAIAYVKEQLEHARNRPAMTIDVVQRDNVTVKRETVRLLFVNEHSGMPWIGSTLGRWFTSVLTNAGIRHRGPNQCRHTFASQALSSYVPVEWVARQLGHSDTTMVKRHYGRWIPRDTKSMATVVSQMMGFRDAQS